MIIIIPYKEYLLNTVIIDEQCLNTDTGEITLTKYVSKNSKKIKGGYGMYYKSLFDVMCMSINSNKEMKIFTWIVQQFTYAKSETNLSYTKFIRESKEKASKSLYIKLLKRLQDLGLIMRVDRGIYRLNPFFVLPYRADSQLLQKEWNELAKEKGWVYDKAMGVYLPKDYHDRNK